MIRYREDMRDVGLGDVLGRVLRKAEAILGDLGVVVKTLEGVYSFVRLSFAS